MNFLFSSVIVISAVILNFGYGVSGNGNYQFPRPQMQLYPWGVEVSIPAEPGMTLMAFHGQINKEFSGLTPGDFSADIRKAVNGRFVYRRGNMHLNHGDRVYFWLHVAFGNKGYNLLNQVLVYDFDYYDYN